ncbi:putative scp-like extracellular protein [Diplogelasinospora grovesii]|uniref:Scp-like extracellular protein n=1 Tax=Diplogelasinospora grovesii TaxID=303347 RepID=A0AAN6N3L1_9PEZI|nr:putative scp-like extracellular protein [Diplogelasinospora grovesii]
MKSSILLASSAAILAAAGPILLEKRVLTTDLVIEWVTVTVTEGQERATMWHPVVTSTTPTTSSTPEATASTPPVLVAAPAKPEPTTTTAPAVAPPAATPPATTESPTTESPAIASPTVPATAEEAATSAAASSPALASPTDFASTALYHHNIHRFNHSAPALTWGESYASYAATIAANCVFQHNMTVGGGGYGQNIAMWASSGDAQALGANTAMAQAATDMWYNGEVTKWPAADYGKPNPDFTNFEQWGHFSQLVWKSSQQVGCASQYCPPGTMAPGMGSWFTVCNYYPPGNMGGEYGDNVLPPLGEPTVTA